MTRSNSAPRSIKTDIRVADVLEAFRDDINLRFICYGIAKILNLRYNISPINPDNDHASFSYKELDAIYGVGSLALQIDKQLFFYLVDLGFQKAEHTHYGFKFGDFYLTANGESVNGVLFAEFGHQFRIQVMEMILAKDPDAMFNINLDEYDLSTF